MMRYFSILCCLLLPAGAAAQNSYNWWDARKPAPVAAPARPAPKPAAVAPTLAPTDSLPLTSGGYIRLEQMPVFPGGQTAMLNFIKSRLKHPKGQRMSGTMYIAYTVLASGAVTNAHVAPGRGLSPAYDAAVTDVVSQIRSFSPGKRNNAPADMEVTIPIQFP